MVAFVVLTILLAVAVLLALAWPVLKAAQAASGSEPAVAGGQETLGELLAQRDAAFQAIRELQFDHQVGKITDEDLAMYEGSLKQNAAEVLRRLDAWERTADLELGFSLEDEVAARRQALASGTTACPSCGRLVAAGNQFCTACGSALAAPAERAPAVQKGPACPRCGKSIQLDDRFCPRCGQPLAPPMRGNPVAG